MMTVKSLTALIWRRNSGATAIEYALIAAGIAVVIVGGVALVGGNLTNVFNSIGSAL